jgi:hypothetical protein
MSDDGQMDFEGGEEGYYDPDEIKSAEARILKALDQADNSATMSRI